MMSTTLRILKHNPNLKQINIRWAREQCPNHLKQEGSYDVITDRDGHPEALNVVERGIPLVGAPFYRRYRYKLERGSNGKYRRPLQATDVPARVVDGPKR